MDSRLFHHRKNIIKELIYDDSYVPLKLKEIAFLLEVSGQEREELETGVEDPVAMDAALQRLGFRTVATVRKQRKTLKNGDVTACLDKVEGLGCFFELEILGAEDAAARLDAMLQEVSFLPWEVENRTYLELLLL